MKIGISAMVRLMTSQIAISGPRRFNNFPPGFW